MSTRTRRMFGTHGALAVARANGERRPTCVACGRHGGVDGGPLVEQGRDDHRRPLMWHVGCAPDRESAEADLAYLEDAERPS